MKQEYASRYYIKKREQEAYEYLKSVYNSNHRYYYMQQLLRELEELKERKRVIDKEREEATKAHLEAIEMVRKTRDNLRFHDPYLNAESRTILSS